MWDVHWSSESFWYGWPWNLIKKTWTLWIRETCNGWFCKYLKNRKQYVSINGAKSDFKNIIHGVPQGSVLGLLLFIIYIFDLPNALIFSENVLFQCFNIHPSLFCWNVLNVFVYTKFLCVYKISFNVSKTKVLLFCNIHKTINHNVRLKLNGKVLFFSRSVKYLGIYLDDLLSWKPHRDMLNIKLRKANGLISKLRHFASKSILI